MFKNKAEFEAEAHFDGEAAGVPGAEAQPYARHLAIMREGAREAARHQPIADAQFSSFMAGIQEGIRAQEPSGYRWRTWASLLSLSTAALLIAFSAFWAFSPAQQPVNATVVESATTDLEDTVVDVYNSEYGVTTVWVNTAKDDL